MLPNARIVIVELDFLKEKCVLNLKGRRTLENPQYRNLINITNQTRENHIR